MNLTKDFCLVCKKEMRKLISEQKCWAMCVNQECEETGKVYETVWDWNEFNIELTIEIDGKKYNMFNREAV